MLKEHDLPLLLMLAGKKIKETRLPRFENPENLIDGDELIEVKTGTLSGAFVIGLQTYIPIYALRVGASIDLSAEFELALRRLPNDKFEVSIEPKRIKEISLFAGALNILGAAQIKTISMARKQIFLFDFKQVEAKKAYFDLIHLGRLPFDSEIEVYSEGRGPEYLLSEVRLQNINLKKRGIQRTYVEAINIQTAKSYAGFNAPVVPAILKLINKSHNKLHKRKEAQPDF